MDSKHRTLCKKLMEQLCRHRLAGPFLAPVDSVALSLPDYYSIIKTPMDFGTIEEKIKNKEYDDLFQFTEDVRLVFRNCYAYNRPRSDICKMAKKLEAVFEMKLEQLQKLPSEVNEDLFEFTEEEESTSEGSNLMEKEEEESFERDSTFKRKSLLDSDYEKKRQRNIARNKEMIKQLGLDGFFSSFEKSSNPSVNVKRRIPPSPSKKHAKTPTRASKRKRGFQYTPLFVAVRDRVIEDVEELLRKGDCAINQTNGINEETALHLAVTLGDAEITQLLLQCEGIHVNVEDIRGLTPLSLSTSNGFTEISNMLIEAGAVVVEGTEKRKPPSRPVIDWGSTPVLPGSQTRCTCCHTCRTSLALYPREFKACASCPYIVCKNCFESKPYIGVSWEEAQRDPQWSCGVCEGTCVCGRCCTRGPPRWYGHKTALRKASEQRVNETVTNPPREMTTVNLTAAPQPQATNQKKNNSLPGQRTNGHCTCCHICRKSVGQTPFKSCTTCPYIICQQCFGKRIPQTWEEALVDISWSCTVCHGVCSCSRCKTRGPPGWFGTVKKKSEPQSSPPEMSSPPPGPPTPTTGPPTPATVPTNSEGIGTPTIDLPPMLDTAIQLKDTSLTDSLRLTEPSTMPLVSQMVPMAEVKAEPAAWGDIVAPSDDPKLSLDITTLFNAEDFVAKASPLFP